MYSYIWNKKQKAAANERSHSQSNHKHKQALVEALLH